MPSIKNKAEREEKVYEKENVEEVGGILFSLVFS